MRKLLFSLALVAATGGLLVLAALVGVPLHFGPLLRFAATNCEHNEEIASAERASLEAAGLRFVKLLVSGDPASAAPAMSAEAQRSVSAEQLSTISRQIVQSMGPFDDLDVTDSYLVRVTGQPASVICGRLGRPEDWVAVASSPISKQGHVVARARGRNNDGVFVLWLIPDKDWSIQYFHFTMMSIVGKSAQDFWTLARTERDLRHDFNAVLLFATAAQLAFRGPNFQLGITPEIQKEISNLKRPDLLSGQVPFAWKFGSNSFKILQLGPIGVGSKVYLNITQELSPWPLDADADLKNRELIAEFKRAVPEYATVFAGLVITAQDKNGKRGFRTVDAPLDQPH